MNENESKLQMYFWDGMNWRLLGGIHDKTQNTVSCKTTHFGKFAIFPLGAIPNEVAPEEKFITPHIPATFGYKAEKVTVYDVSGNTVIELFKNDFGGSVIEWNGQDENSKFIESGAYIYRIEDTDGETTYGNIIMAK